MNKLTPAKTVFGIFMIALMSSAVTSIFWERFTNTICSFLPLSYLVVYLIGALITVIYEKNNDHNS